jgi:hypothetical protein
MNHRTEDIKTYRNLLITFVAFALVAVGLAVVAGAVA